MSGMMTWAIIAVVLMVIAFIVFAYFKSRDLIAQRKAAEQFRKSKGTEGMPKGGNPKLGTRRDDTPLLGDQNEFLSGLYPKSRNGQASGSRESIKDVKDPHRTEKITR